MAWRKKMMPAGEWSRFQDLFEEIVVRSGGQPQRALFMQHEAGSDLDGVFIAGEDLAAIETLSPGGWEDSGPPHGDNVSLLVGDQGAWVRFGA